MYLAAVLILPICYSFSYANLLAVCEIRCGWLCTYFKPKSNIVCSLFLGNNVGEGVTSAAAWNTTSLAHETWLRGGGKCGGRGPWTGSHPAGRPPPPTRTPPAVRPKPRTGSPPAGRSPPPALPAPTGRSFPVE